MAYSGETWQSLVDYRTFGANQNVELSSALKMILF